MTNQINIPAGWKLVQVEPTNGESPVFEGGQESVDDALLVVESFGPGISGLNDTFARQIILVNEVKRLRATKENNNE